MESRVDATLRHNGLKNFDFAVFKRTTFGERAGLDFRTELFNLFNHPQFGFPGTNFVSGSSNGFRQVTSQLNNPRLIQFALKFKVLICAIHRLRADARSLRQTRITMPPMPPKERQTNSSSLFVW